MNRFKYLNYILVVIIVCFIGVIIFGSNFLLPKFQEFSGLRQRVEEKRNEIKYKQEYFSNLTETKTELKKYEAELSKIDSALPDDSFMPSLFNYLQKSSSQSGLVLKDMGTFNISQSEKAPNLKEITLSLGVSGPYSSFKSFLSNLEKSTRMIEVESVSFSASQEQQTLEEGKQKEKDVFNFNLILKVYSY